jgi:hypothetical protein
VISATFVTGFAAFPYVLSIARQNEAVGMNRQGIERPQPAELRPANSVFASGLRR